MLPGLTLPLASHPAVVGIYDDHGIDLLSPPTDREFFGFVRTDPAVESTDPWRLVVETELNGERLRLVVDGSLEVLKHERY